MKFVSKVRGDNNTVEHAKRYGECDVKDQTEQGHRHKCRTKAGYSLDKSCQKENGTYEKGSFHTEISVKNRKN